MGSPQAVNLQIPLRYALIPALMASLLPPDCPGCNICMQACLLCCFPYRHGWDQVRIDASHTCMPSHAMRTFELCALHLYGTVCKTCMRTVISRCVHSWASSCNKQTLVKHHSCKNALNSSYQYKQNSEIIKHGVLTTTTMSQSSRHRADDKMNV